MRDKNHFLERTRREMGEGLGAFDLSPAETPAFLLQSHIVRGTFAYWARRSAD